MQRVFAALCGVAALVLGGFGVETAFSAPERAPVLLKTDEGIPQSAQSFLDSLRGGDLDGASAYLVGTPDLAPKEELGEAQKMVWEAYIASMDFRLEGTVYGTNQGPAMDVTLQALDIDSLCARLRELVPQTLERQIASAKDVAELYDAEGGYRQTLTDRVLLLSLEQALGENPQTKETRVTLHFVYSGGQWQIQPESGLIAFLSGNMSGG